MAPEAAAAPGRADLEAAGWWEAERRAGHVPGAGPVEVPAGPRGPGLLPPGTPEAPQVAGLLAPPGQASGNPLGGSVPARAGKRRGWAALAHLWALAKLATLAYTAHWAMALAHARLGPQLSAYGVTCLFAGFGARWRRRSFGPGQVLEPELYEELGRWLYRLGTVLVVCGGAVTLLAG